jgi:signal transduction histidine kinase
MASVVAEYIRTHNQALVAEWEGAVLRELHELARLERGALIDHVPEVLEGLAAWLEGDTAEAEAAFAALADGHAVQRLGFGFELPVLNVEYAALRRVLLRGLLPLESTPELRRELIRLNEGLDRAINLSVRRYSERRDQVRDRFVGILGHDLRGPLNAAAVATATLLRSPTLAEPDRKRLLVLERATKRMARMIADVLDFARGHLGGGIPATPIECNMGEICRAAVEELQCAHPDQEVSLTTRGDLHGHFDRERALQAIANLLGNAFEHGRGAIEVAAWESDDRAAVFTRVSNAGPPIPAALADNLFEPFTRRTGERGDGLGLGLYIVAQIARAHGGTCHVSSSADATALTIRWPRVPSAEVPDRT